MSSEIQIEFSRENIDSFLREVAKEYRKQVGKGMPAEIILIGGASILINYGFRQMTTDIDAEINAASAIKDCINQVGNKHNLPLDWFNQSFKTTESYSPKLKEFSKPYRIFSNVLSIRTISSEYLIAMKLRSGRSYKNDLSDVVGILASHKKAGTPITIDQIKTAVIDLYDDWNALPERSISFINNLMESEQYDELYDQVLAGERETKSLMITFEKEYPNITNISNADSIASNLQNKSASASAIIARLRSKKPG